MLVRARLSDVVADGVGLAGVGDAAGTALALGHHGELAVHRRARQGPAVHLPLLRSQVGDTETKDRVLKKIRYQCIFQHDMFECWSLLLLHLAMKGKAGEQETQMSAAVFSHTQCF